jgi:hypothetical protein
MSFSSNNLKPCPKCNGKKVMLQGGGLEFYHVICIDCNFKGPFHTFSETAMELWNKRCE